MKKQHTAAYLILSLLFFLPHYSQTQTSNSTSQHKHGILENLFGNGDDEFVCYNKVHRNFYSGIFLVTIGLTIVSYSRYRIKRKASIELSSMNAIIQEKNKDITASINYAKRIQQAKLPGKEQIYSALPQSFILFKPKDIVSGDFYYFNTYNNTIFIASADCTGHGVPGALMSMLCSEKLDDALIHSTDPSEILNYLNKRVKLSLRQSDSNESTRDGMDIALCCLDKESRVVRFVGANRPIWIIRNGSKEVEEIKPTKKAIGGLTEESQHFISHEIKLQPNDTFYIFTDGYPDTFGEQENKKLTTKKFKEILVSIQSQSMQEQEHYLDHFIEKWKGKTEQIDDILVVGVRL